MRPATQGELPLVSIVTPSLDQAEFIEDAIRSVLDQEYPNIEYLVVDGGSRDGTLEILRQHGDSLRWTSDRDKGQSDAINHGFAATSGEIIAWLNADDRYVPDAVRAAVEAFEQDPSLDLVYGQAAFIDRAGHSLGSRSSGHRARLHSRSSAILGGRSARRTARNVAGERAHA
jgi:glycosyltransferase involved in cell wall biosynthesis